MILMYCGACGDVVRLLSGVRVCQCGQSRGWHPEDGSPVRVSGEKVETVVAADGEFERASAWVSKMDAPIGSQGPIVNAMMLQRNDGMVIRNGAEAPLRGGGR